jgi:hypothetical protein
MVVMADLIGIPELIDTSDGGMPVPAIAWGAKRRQPPVSA